MVLAGLQQPSLMAAGCSSHCHHQWLHIVVTIIAGCRFQLSSSLVAGSSGHHHHWLQDPVAIIDGCCSHH